MKDLAHHKKHIQRKVLRDARKEAELSPSSPAIDAEKQKKEEDPKTLLSE